MSPGARKRLRKAVDIMVQSIKPRWIWNEVSGHPHIHKLSFITLTISSTERNLTAAEAYKELLRPFLQWLTKYQEVKMYIWKAELQKRGQMHYHITTPTFVRYDLIKTKWNELQKKAGLLEGYYRSKGHYHPNSTDVHEVYKVKDVAAYLSKYLAKEIDSASKKEGEIAANTGKTVGKVWDCSMSLKKAQYFQVDTSNSFRDRISAMKAKGIVELYSTERCTIIKCINCKPVEMLSKSERINYDLHMKAIRDGNFDNHVQKLRNERITFNASQELTGSMAANSKQVQSSGKAAVKQVNRAHPAELTLFDDYLCTQSPAAYTPPCNAPPGPRSCKHANAQAVSWSTS